MGNISGTDSTGNGACSGLSGNSDDTNNSSTTDDSGSGSGSGGSIIWIIIVVVILLMMMGLLLWWYMRRRRKNMNTILANAPPLQINNPEGPNPKSFNPTGYNYERGGYHPQHNTGSKSISFVSGDNSYTVDPDGSLSSNAASLVKQSLSQSGLPDSSAYSV